MHSIVGASVSSNAMDVQAHKIQQVYMYVWEYVIVEYICILDFAIRTPGQPMRRVYSSVPLTLFCVIACTGEAYYGL